MRILWLCNIVLPEFCGFYGIKRYNAGGWLSGMWEELKGRTDLELAVCTPIRDRERMKDGQIGNTSCFAFHMSSDKKDLDEQTAAFLGILERFTPDIIHIWGTEYQHTLAMVLACEIMGMTEQVVIHIQGLISVCQKRYCYGIPDSIINKEDSRGNSIYKEWVGFAGREVAELEALRKISNVMGRTDWDRACSRQINRNLVYHFCGENLQDVFYKHLGEWTQEGCTPHTIFISQGSYPIKGLHLIIRNLANLKKTFADLKVHIAGDKTFLVDSPYGRFIADLIKDNNMEDSITFLGTVVAEDMYQYYVKANVFLSASTMENSSNSICEALAIGVPVVASMVGGTPDLISHKENGFLYTLGEEYMMQFYIEELFGNAKLCKQISKTGAKRIRNLVDRKQNCERTVGIYQSIYLKKH